MEAESSRVAIVFSIYGMLVRFEKIYMYYVHCIYVHVYVQSTYLHCMNIYIYIYIT